MKVPTINNGRAGDRDQHGLTTRNVQVLRLMMRGRNSKQIARALGIAPGTVKATRSALLELSSASSSCQLGAWAARHGYTESNPPSESGGLMRQSDAAAITSVAAGGAA